MKLFLIIISSIFFSSIAFADAFTELSNGIIKNANSPEFQQADKNINDLINKGSELSEQGKYTEALNTLNQALKEADKLYGKESTAAATVYTTIGSVHMKKGEYLKSADTLLKAANIYKSSAGGALRPKAYYNLLLLAASIYSEKGKPSKALKLAADLQKNIKMLSPEKRAKVYYIIAECYYDKEKFAKAESICVKREKILFHEDVQLSLQAKYYDLWANCLIGLNKNKEAISKLHKCVVFSLKTKMPTSFIGQVRQTLGATYIKQDDYQNAKKYLLEAISTFQKIDEDISFWLGTTYLLLARNARFHKKWPEAETYYWKASKLFEKHLTQSTDELPNDRKTQTAITGLSVTFKWLAVCLLYNENLTKIDSLYSKLPWFKKICHSPKLLADIYKPWIGIYINLGKYKRASNLIEKALRIYKKLPQNNQTKNSTAFLLWSKAKILHLTGKSKEAYKLGLQASKILNISNSNNPKNLSKIKSILKSMKDGTPFK
ncbi:MAG: tetratricopeptide repeat protein [Lentisphaerae bacterium]|nr:tetratricopeptide repeat protein [Lentisphaerota bacterium]MCP4101179.1 tetratricopeptide repeat protein [Lentisphaerota bacterium]